MLSKNMFALTVSSAAVLILGAMATAQAQKLPKVAIEKPVDKVAVAALETTPPPENADANGIAPSEDGTAGEKAFVKKALTWKVAKTQVIGGKTYVLMSHDYGPSHFSNPYQGDTSIKQRRSLLCLKKSEKPTPDPKELKPLNVTTPGGALSYSWSSAKMIAIPNVLGSDLTSRAVADQKCNTMGQMVYGVSGYRMAEFHDGKAGANPGWSFWVEGYSVLEGLDVNGLYWIAINGQPANPW
jgi:hypothetical protein